MENSRPYIFLTHVNLLRENPPDFSKDYGMQHSLFYTLFFDFYNPQGRLLTGNLGLCRKFMLLLGTEMFSVPEKNIIS